MRKEIIIMRYFALVLFVVACSSQGQGLNSVGTTASDAGIYTAIGTGTSTTPSDAEIRTDTGSTEAITPDSGVVVPSPDTQLVQSDTQKPVDTLVKVDTQVVIVAEPQQVVEPQQSVPEPNLDGGVSSPDTSTRTCGLAGQACCKNQVCNVGLSCSEQGSCIASQDGGVSADTKPAQPDTFKYQFPDTKVREPDTQTDTRPACGRQEQGCCLTNTEESDFSAEYLKQHPDDWTNLSSLLAQINCPLSWGDGYVCVTYIDIDHDSGAPRSTTRTCQKSPF